MLHWGAWQPIFLVQNTRKMCPVELIVMHTEQRVPTPELMDEQFTALPSFWFSAYFTCKAYDHSKVLAPSRKNFLWM
jgi:hypothetical protein